MLDPQRRHVQPQPADPCHHPPAFTSHGEALAWCDTEQANVTAAAQMAAAVGEDAIAWRLTVALWGYYILRKPRREWITVCHAGLDCARRAGDRSGEAQLLVSLGICHVDLRELDSATCCLQQALDIWPSWASLRSTYRSDCLVRAWRWDV